MTTTAPVQRALEEVLRNTVLPGCKPRIAQRWAGIMGFSADRQPAARCLSERIVLGFGCNGMGVALSAEVAAQTARLLA